jgi:hypothetical protein
VTHRLVLIVAILQVGCISRFGPQLREVVSERGYAVRVSLQGNEEVSGELLSVDDAGVLVLVGETVTRVHWSDLRDVVAPAGRHRWIGAGMTPDERREMALYSRFPPGFSQDQLQALLARHGQQEPVVVTPGGQTSTPGGPTIRDETKGRRLSGREGTSP